MGVNTGVSVAAGGPKLGGGLYYAPLGTALPVDAKTALAAGYKALGPISDAGITPSRDTSVEKVKEWDGSTLAQLLTDESRSFETLLYGVFDAEVQTFINGAGNVTVTPATVSTGTLTTVLDKGGKPAQCVMVIELLYGAKVLRKVIPVADPVITGEEAYAKSSLMGYTLSIEALKDTSGVRVYEYGDDGKFSA